MTGFKPRTSDIGSDRSTNWATTTALLPLLCADFTFLLHLNTRQSQKCNNALWLDSLKLGKVEQSASFQTILR